MHTTHLEVHSIDRPSLPCNISITSSCISKKHVTKFFPTLSNNNYSKDIKFIILLVFRYKPLVVIRPCQVLDWARDWLELVLQDVLLVHSVPNPHLARLISGGDIESTRTVLRHIHLTAVLGVDVGHLGAVQVPDDDTVSMTVEEVLPLRICSKHNRLTPLRARQGSKGEPVGEARGPSHDLTYSAKDKN